MSFEWETQRRRAELISVLRASGFLCSVGSLAVSVGKVDRHYLSGGVYLEFLTCTSNIVRHGLFEDSTPYRPSAESVLRAVIVKFVRVVRADHR